MVNVLDELLQIIINLPESKNLNSRSGLSDSDNVDNNVLSNSPKSALRGQGDPSRSEERTVRFSEPMVKESKNHGITNNTQLPANKKEIFTPILPSRYYGTDSKVVELQPKEKYKEEQARPQDNSSTNNWLTQFFLPIQWERRMEFRMPLQQHSTITVELQGSISTTFDSTRTSDLASKTTTLTKEATANPSINPQHHRQQLKSASFIPTARNTRSQQQPCIGFFGDDPRRQKKYGSPKKPDGKPISYIGKEAKNRYLYISSPAVQKKILPNVNKREEYFNRIALSTVAELDTEIYDLNRQLSNSESNNNLTTPQISKIQHKLDLLKGLQERNEARKRDDNKTTLLSTDLARLVSPQLANSSGRFDYMQSAKAVLNGQLLTPPKKPKKPKTQKPKIRK